ncbi:MAG TPA: aminotransferase class V-fold PLP-dependent enzyme [Micromonosporaceae bacterium]
MLPSEGLAADAVLAEITAMREADLPTHGGTLFAYVYDPAVPGLDELTTAAYALASHVNGLDPTAFPSLLAMENALVGAAAGLLGGDGDTVGSVTSGGTESLILAVKAARDARPDIAEPRLTMPASAHAAFAKAAHYLGVGMDIVPVDPVTLTPDPTAMAGLIGPDTVLVVASAPSYAHGVIDPVEPIATAAAAAGVRCHVDGCFGGWVLPYLSRLGAPIPPFDFSVPGVTSISVDLHKYAYTPKGVSILLHRDAALRAPQYFAWADWPGYTMINPVISSTRSGGPIAAAYATLRFIGDAGYLELARATREAVAALAGLVRNTDGLRLMTEPLATVVAFTSDDPALDLFVLADELALRGWHTQPQMSYDQLPVSIHLSVTASVAPRVGDFAAVLADAVAAARAAGPATVPAEIAAMASVLTPDALTPETVAGLAESLGLGGADPHPRMAPVNAILDLAPPRLREKLLVEFLSLLQRPT